MEKNMEEKNKVTNLIKGVLEEEDYKFRINFLIGGMMCEESNDTPEKIKKNQEWLNETVEFCKAYTGDKKEYLDHIKENNFFLFWKKNLKCLRMKKFKKVEDT